MKRHLLALSLCFLATLLIIVTIPRSLKNVVATELYPTAQVSIQQASETSGLRSRVSSLQAQANSPSETTTPQAKEQNYPVTLDGETLFSFSIERVAKNLAIELDSRLLLNIGFVIVEAIGLTLWMILLRKLLNRINRRIDVFSQTLLRPINIQDWQVLSVEQEVNIAKGFIKSFYWLFIAAIFFIFVSLLTQHLPQTQPWREAVSQSLGEFLDKKGKAAIEYLPNLFTIILAIIIAYYLIRLCRFFFGAIRRGHLSIPGFYPEWAKPTQRLMVVLIIALTLATIFPILPGAKSDAFRGISIFTGALFTLGGASTIANLVGGFIIIYTRAFQIGDCVQVGDVIGIILEKTILSTRVRTAKNEIVTIPNANLITTNIKNFTAAYRDINQPLILHTVVTLGYDVPWRKVHQVLKDAAFSTSLILKDPAPFILQTSLGDFSVSYELNAYTEQSSQMPKIYSELHQNIQDKCNEAGIEILSPQYSAVRDGNQNTMPEKYLPEDYQVSGFRLNPLDSLLNKSKDNNGNRLSDR